MNTYYIDASLLTHSNCLRRILFMQQGYTKYPISIKMEYGTAFHKGLHSYYSDGDQAKAIAIAAKHYDKFNALIPEKEFRTPLHLRKALKAYFLYYGTADALKPLIEPKSGEKLLEIKFDIPIEEVFPNLFKANDFNNKYHLVGTIDCIADYAQTICIVDHKSTGAFKINEYMDQYFLNIQSRFYSFIYNVLTSQGYIPFIMNGIFLKKNTDKATKLGEFDGASFERSPIINFTQEQMDEFVAWLGSTINSICIAVDNDLAYPNFAACDEKFSRCLYTDVCQYGVSLHKDILNTKYVTKLYNPLTFQE